jgi:hypothetical protein
MAMSSTGLRSRARSHASSLSLALMVWSLGSLSACSRCSDEPRVPFKLNPPPELGVPELRADAATPVASAQSFETPVDKLTVEGASLVLAHVRASLEVDLDADGDHDLLLLRQDDVGELHKLQLVAVTRDGATFSLPRPVAGFVEQELGTCSLAEPRFSALSSTKASLSVHIRCTDPSSQLAPLTSLSLLSLDAMPRVYERIDVIATDSNGGPALTLAPHGIDADGDGHDDIGITVTGRGAVEPDALELLWLDRPSGLVRDPREPETTLSAWASAAQSLLAKSPEQAVARADLALTLQRAVCRELGTPLLSISGTPGVPCGTMKSTGALLLSLVSGHARRGELGAAFDAYRTLRRTEPRPPERELEKATSALLKLHAEPGITLRRGPRVEPVERPRVHLPSARFLGDSTLYVHRLSPILFDLERNEETAAPSATDQLMRDPSGQLIASVIERTCEGQAVRIERAPPRGSDYTAAKALASAVIAPSPAAPGCNRNSTRPDDGGFTLLGWAPQGLLAVRGSEVRLVPLGSDGRALGPARTLPPDAPRPAPLPSGSATADGARYVEATPYGVLVYGPSSTSLALWRPEGYTAIAQGPLEAAISPSGLRVALVAGHDVYLLEQVSR